MDLRTFNVIEELVRSDWRDKTRPLPSSHHEAQLLPVRPRTLMFGTVDELMAAFDAGARFELKGFSMSNGHVTGMVRLTDCVMMYIEDGNGWTIRPDGSSFTGGQGYAIMLSRPKEHLIANVAMIRRDAEGALKPQREKPKPIARQTPSNPRFVVHNPDARLSGLGFNGEF